MLHNVCQVGHNANVGEIMWEKLIWSLYVRDLESLINEVHVPYVNSKHRSAHFFDVFISQWLCVAFEGVKIFALYKMNIFFSSILSDL